MLQIQLQKKDLNKTCWLKLQLFMSVSFIPLIDNFGCPCSLMWEMSHRAHVQKTFPQRIANGSNHDCHVRRLKKVVQQKKIHFATTDTVSVRSQYHTLYYIKP